MDSLHCSDCGLVKDLESLFRCIECRKVFCDEHAAYDMGAICTKCFMKDEADKEV